VGGPCRKQYGPVRGFRGGPLYDPALQLSYCTLKPWPPCAMPVLPCQKMRAAKFPDGAGCSSLPRRAVGIHATRGGVERQRGRRGKPEGARSRGSRHAGPRGQEPPTQWHPAAPTYPPTHPLSSRLASKHRERRQSSFWRPPSTPQDGCRARSLR
jgi:hypothetical protein